MLAVGIPQFNVVLRQSAADERPRSAILIRDTDSACCRGDIVNSSCRGSPRPRRRWHRRVHEGRSRSRPVRERRQSITVTVYSTFHSSCACCAVSRSTRGFGPDSPGAKGRPNRRASIAIHSGPLSGRPTVVVRSVRLVIAASADATPRCRLEGRSPSIPAAPSFPTDLPSPMSAPRTSTSGSAFSCATDHLTVGDKIRLIPGHCDPTVNLYDRYVGVRAGRIGRLWPITALGAMYDMMRGNGSTADRRATGDDYGTSVTMPLIGCPHGLSSAYGGAGPGHSIRPKFRPWPLTLRLPNGVRERSTGECGRAGQGRPIRLVEQSADQKPR